MKALLVLTLLASVQALANNGSYAMKTYSPADLGTKITLTSWAIACSSEGFETAGAKTYEQNGIALSAKTAGHFSCDDLAKSMKKTGGLLEMTIAKVTAVEKKIVDVISCEASGKVMTDVCDVIVATEQGLTVNILINGKTYNIEAVNRLGSEPGKATVANNSI